ncbi:MAG: OsmC family protein [Deltaproteobacteria bacterium]|nr:OsmC family protein [Deltaproteobacteria bacterium]
MPKVSVRSIQGKQLMGTARQHAVIFDQPSEKGGTDLGFTPTELFLFALGSCLSYNMLAYGQRNGMKIDRLQVELVDEVSKSPERISKVTAQINISGELGEEEVSRLLRSAKGCKIHNTLSAVPEIEVAIQKM